MTTTGTHDRAELERRVERAERVMAEHLADALVRRDIARRLGEDNEAWLELGSVVAFGSALYNLTGRTHQQIESEAEGRWRAGLHKEIERLRRVLDSEQDYDLDEPQREVVRRRLAVTNAMASEYDEANTGVAL